MSDSQAAPQVAGPFPLSTLRHSVSHLMASAVAKLFPGVQFGFGPAIEHGFYYDFDVAQPFSDEDLKAIEKEMRRIAKTAPKLVCVAVDREEARRRLGAKGQSYKVEAVDLIPEGEAITFYQHGDWEDLCEGPHIDHFGRDFHFKLLNVAGAYWRGDEKRPQMKRVYGTAFWTFEELEKHLRWLEEIKERDHRVVGKQLRLFHIDEMVGQGLVLWTPHGSIIRGELQAFISEELRRQGYHQVYTPHIGKLDLYKTSGHFPYYKESQFPAIVEADALAKLSAEGCSCAELTARLDGVSAHFASTLNARAGREVVGKDKVLPDDKLVDGYLLKPMNCPHHIRIYASSPHSYRDLPVRLAEFGTVYRWEQSGEIGGLTRVRGFTQDDAHLFVREDQVAQELLGCLSLVKLVFGTLGMHDYRVRVSLRDPDSTKYVGSPENWDKAEEACRAAARTLGVPWEEVPGEAAFYGPKIDFIVRDVIGRSWQLGTVQVDYNGPIRFDLTYTGADNQKHRPVMIHRAPFGSMERFVGVLIEHFGGRFPFWLSPVQVALIPIREEHAPYCVELEARLKAEGLRVDAMLEPSHMNNKIKEAQKQRIPFMLVAGEREAAEKTVTVRRRDTREQETIPFEQFLALARRLRDERGLDLGPAPAPAPKPQG
jgi:threonyl-tRNA synthetase